MTTLQNTVTDCSLDIPGDIQPYSLKKNVTTLALYNCHIFPRLLN